MPAVHTSTVSRSICSLGYERGIAETGEGDVPVGAVLFFLFSKHI